MATQKPSGCRETFINPKTYKLLNSINLHQLHQPHKPPYFVSSGAFPASCFITASKTRMRSGLRL